MRNIPLNYLLLLVFSAMLECANQSGTKQTEVQKMALDKMTKSINPDR